ncbi:LapA family protein [Amycolatopsis jejuensis]|uniref:LapA family protein n=1 Tax=Amycolatopsis jejuensis TaxID=330084 RepID=UPI000526C383|nr:lipopolysaccharide assembly protein LapA domain-containing protein [Amycolatopsis jejuensis]
MSHARNDDPTGAAKSEIPEAPGAEVPGALEPAGEPAPPVPPVPGGKAKVKPTRISGTWIAVVVAIVVLVFLLIFILQNLDTATVHFLGISGSMPLAVAMLFAAIAGAALVALIGGARILQLRKQARRRK